MRAEYKLGDKVKVREDNDNENYKDFKNKVLIITSIATSIEEHRGFDTGINQPLYDLEDEKGKEIPFSLYEYELETA